MLPLAASHSAIPAGRPGRRAYLMEIDPLYCDVIVQRWEQFTGKKAKRIEAKNAVEITA